MAGFRSIEHTSEPAGPIAPEAAPAIESSGNTPATKGTAEFKDPNRPSWLPDKFKDPTELAKAYSELESKLGKAAPETDAKTSPPDEPLAIKPGEPQQADPDTFIETYSKEFFETGKLSDESYSALKEKGYTKKMVDAFIAGQQAVLEQGRNQVFGLVGGEKNYGDMLQWASTNLDKTEIDAYNKAVTSGDMAMITMAVNGLNARFNGTKGPKLVQGSPQSGPAGFVSRSELAKAVADPKYNSDPEYRRRVMERLQASRF